jgi:arsenite oxidase large subunit
MAYKRQIDRLPIIPADATRQNVTCHYCIVGCGYNAYSWPINKQGGTAAADNVLGVDLSEQQYADSDAWYSPSMYNIVKQNGRDVHLVIKPDQECVVNSGLGSVRGARMAELFARKVHPAAAPHRSACLAVRPDAADVLGRRPRSGGARHRPRCRR